MPLVRLYGYDQGEQSFTQVTRGIRTTLEGTSALAGFVSLNGPGAAEGDEPPGYAAPVSLNIGPHAGLAVAHRMGGHERHWLLLAPNADPLPRGLAASLTKTGPGAPRGLVSGLLTPSAWGASVLRREFPGMPVVVAPHGINPDVHCPKDNIDELTTAYDAGVFRVVHLTSTDSDRKGTKALLRAWKAALEAGQLPPHAFLCIVATVHSRIRWWVSDLELGPNQVRVIPGLELRQHEMAELLRAAHLVCQPSRGEGFGVVGLEALACGTPICVTAATGHAEWLGSGLPGATIIRTGDASPTDEYPGALAPSLAPSDIQEALALAWAKWPEQKALAYLWATTTRTEWSWSAKNTLPLRQMLRESEVT